MTPFIKEDLVCNWCVPSREFVAIDFVKRCVKTRLTRKRVATAPTRVSKRIRAQKPEYGDAHNF